MNCENHADREGILAVDLPSIGIRRFMCMECKAAFDLRLLTPYKGRREWWIENEPFWGWNEEYRIRREPEHNHRQEQ